MFSKLIKEQPEHQYMTKKFNKAIDLSVQLIAAINRNDTTSIRVKKNQIHQANIDGLESIKMFLASEERAVCDATIKNLKNQIV